MFQKNVNYRGEYLSLFRFTLTFVIPKPYKKSGTDRGTGWHWECSKWHGAEVVTTGSQLKTAYLIKILFIS